MRLRRIEAVRYGALAGETLGDLSDGLTVVQGPNEAGKSTYTALVRHVLYGYPTQREVEQGYHVGGEGRRARLVFSDGDGSWVVERAEGVRGGSVAVRSLNGQDRPALLDELVQGVSPATYRTVFAFGLDEMGAIERERASDDGVVTRLYAAGAGLRVNPQEVRSAIQREADELFKPGGRKQPVNELVSEIRATRAELRELRAQADDFLADQERLAGMEAQLESARQARDDARERLTELAVALERADERLGIIAAEEEARPSLLRERTRMAEEGARLEVDESLLSAAPEVEALLEEAAGHARALQSLRDSESTLERAWTRATDAAERTGLATEALASLGDAPDAQSAIDEARDDLQRLQMQCEGRDEAVRRCEADLEQAQTQRDRLLAPLGIQGEPEEQIAERIAAIDAVEALRGAVHGRRGPDIAAIILLVSGIVALAAGILLREWLTAAIGAVLAAAGTFFMLRSGGGGQALPVGEEREYLRLLGLGAGAGPLELSRTRRALETARGAVAALSDAHQRLEEGRRESALGCDALATRRELWAGWLAGHGLDPSLSPASAAAVLALVREARTQRALAAEAEQSHERAVAELDAFASRFASVAGPFLGLAGELARDEVRAQAIRLKEDLARAHAGAARREELEREIAAIDARIAQEAERGTKAREGLLEVLERFGVAEGGSHEDLRVLHQIAAERAAEATAHYDALAEAKNQLEGRLEAIGRDSRVGELHLREAGAAERLGDLVDRYLVLEVASRLLGEAQARYQRERQPDVVRQAGRFLATMTDGRYTGLSVPLAEGRIEVFDARAGARTSEILSRGTAEQLYLAVRLGLISQLGEVGRYLPVLMDDVLVNFDPARRVGAARAIAELAEDRQVVFFTCHPDTAELFAEVAPEHVRLDIPRIGL